MRVLLAEDDEHDRRLIERLLAERGHEVAVVDEASAGWERFEQLHPQLIILDWRSPSIGAPDICRRIRAAARPVQPYVMIVASGDSAGALVAAIDAGADDYLETPIVQVHLEARLAIAEHRIGAAASRRQAELDSARAHRSAGVDETTLAVEHEINNPLTALMSHAALAMLEPGASDEQRGHLKIIYDQARRIASVVRRLVELRRPRSVTYVRGTTMIDLSEDDADIQAS